MVRGNVGRPLVTLCMEIDKTSKELQRVEVGGWWWGSGGVHNHFARRGLTLMLSKDCLLVMS